VGTFGGSEGLLPGILSEPADYFSVGPIFPSKTKQTTKPPIAAEGMHKLRSEVGSRVILVAVGGITLETAPSILDAGATTIAVSAAIFRCAADPAAEFRRWVQELG
jgi:thiamine-phosphate pyrophosphorylase